MAQLSQNGFNFLKFSEGYSNVAYILKGETYPTVGIGHHSRDLINGKRYSDTECMAFFQQDSKILSADVNKIWHTGMTQSMFDAMFSLAYNHGNISSTALGKTIKGDGYKNKSKVTTTWHSSYILRGSRYENGLRKRRVREANLFYSEGYDGNAPEPSNDTYDSNYYDKLAGVNEQYTSDAPSVLSTASANIYSELSNGMTDDGKQRTRIYKYSEPTIKIDELSISLDGSNSPINHETGAHMTPTDASTSSTVSVEDMAGGSLKLSGNEPDITLEAGVTYPIIRINDCYLSYREIDYMEIGCVGFMPTIKLELTTTNNSLLKTNVPKEGDIIAVFCSPGHGMIKSLRCDFLITYVESSEVSQFKVNEPYNFTIMGELNVPNLYNSNMSFSFAGTSRDAMIDAANKLGLGFFFCDPDNTDDNQMWYCMAEGESEEESPQHSNLRDYIIDTVAHSWKNYESFFDAWIDPRYGLTFLNVNKMLGESGPDEPFDVTVFNDVFAHHRGVDNQHGTDTDAEKKVNARPQLKMITNIPNDDEASTAFYAIDFKEVNQAAEITKEVGINVTANYTINNQGVETDNNSVEMSYSIPYNADKYPNGGFYILVGPGINDTYVQADNGSYVHQHAQKQGGRDTDMMADSDGEVIADTGSNELATGNVNKFYDAAYEHNRINNMQLLKKIVRVRLNGANFAMMRGEKIPTLFLDNNKLISMCSTNPEQWDDVSNDQEQQAGDPVKNPRKLSEEEQHARMLNACTYTTLSGWFIIKSIKWTFTNTPKTAQSAWQTELELTRREWPIPGYMNVSATRGETQNNINTEETSGSAPENKAGTQTTNPTGNNDNLNEEIKPEDVVSGDVPLTGLKDFMKNIYRAIETASAKKIKLVGARRYAVDTNGERVSGNAFVMNGDKYKCMDARGKIMYASINNSRHFYGEAIDIINNGMSFDELYDLVILGNGDVLKLMYDHGVSAYTEVSVDDLGTNSKHIHIGTDTQKQKEFWAAANKKMGGKEIVYSGGTFKADNYVAYNNYRQSEIQIKNTVYEGAS